MVVVGVVVVVDLSHPSRLPLRLLLPSAETMEGTVPIMFRGEIVRGCRSCGGNARRAVVCAKELVRKLVHNMRGRRRLVFFWLDFIERKRGKLRVG